MNPGCDQANQTVQAHVDIFEASRRGDVQLLKELIVSGRAKPSDRDDHNATPLHLAALAGQMDTCRYLLEQGAEINAPGGEGLSTPIQWATEHKSPVDVIRLLITHKSDPNSVDMEGWNSLHYVVQTWSVMSLLCILQQQVNVNAQDVKKRTALMLAASKGDDLFVAILLRHGGDPNIRDMNGLSSLHRAVVKGDENCIRKLLENRADITATDLKGRTPKDIAMERGHLDAWKRALEEAGMYQDEMQDPQRSCEDNVTIRSSNMAIQSSIVLWDSQTGVGIDALSHVPEPEPLSPVTSDMPSSENLLNRFMSLTENLELGAPVEVSDVEEAVSIGHVLLWSACHEQPPLTYVLPSTDLLQILSEFSIADIWTEIPLLRRLSICYGFLYQKTEDPEDVDVAIALCRKCIDVNREDIAYDEALLCATLTAKFEKNLDIETINKAITHGRGGLQGAYHDHPIHLFRLANALWVRYNKYRAEEDVDDSIILMRHAIEAAVNSEHFVKMLPTLRNGLVAALLPKILLADQPGLLADECIDILRQGLAHFHPNESHYAQYRNNLSVALRRRYTLASHDPSNINEAISIGEHLVDRNYSRIGVPWNRQWVTMWNLAISFATRYDFSKSAEDLDMAIELLQIMHSDIRSDFLQTTQTDALMAWLYIRRYGIRNDPKDLEASSHLFHEQKDEGVAAVGMWMYCMVQSAFVHHKEHRYDAAMLDYRRALELLPQHLISGRDYQLRQVMNLQWDDIGANAAAAATACGQYGEALGLLELGRAMGWNRNFQMRSELKQLEIDWPDYAECFEELSKLLEEMELAKSLSWPSQISVEQAILGQGSWEERLNIAQQWQAIVTDIRDLEGYKDFLSSPGYDQLKHVSKYGPVVVINVSKYRSDAFILTHSTLDRPQVVRLPSDLHELAQSWADNLLGGVQKMEDDLITESVFSKLVLKPILAELWNHIVQPIRELLNCLAPYARRMWWIPTRWLTPLPLHLVTNGLNDGDNIMMLRLIPSYSITLSSLLRARSSLEQRESPSVLAVGCASSGGFDEIPGTKKEIQSLAKIISSNHETTIDILRGDSASVQRVLSAMSDHTWLHLACHGIQSSEKPYTSYFALTDGHLHMAEIAGARFVNAQFAFLSACHTATGVPALCDEAMHLAAGLQFAGFCGTIATMWSVHDKTAKKLADEVYRFLFRNPKTRPVVEDAAEALWRATQKLKVDGVPMSRLAPFIHIGV